MNDILIALPCYSCHCRIAAAGNHIRKAADFAGYKIDRSSVNEKMKRTNATTDT